MKFSKIFVLGFGAFILSLTPPAAFLAFVAFMNLIGN
jgi:hypothetical protein